MTSTVQMIEQRHVVNSLATSAPASRESPAVAAAAAQARALVSARYEMALHRPRNMDAVRQTMLKESSRPSFANDKSTLYRKPVGDGIEGLGIRFAEMALRSMTNVMVESRAVHDDADVRIITVTVTDLESNVPFSQDVTVRKTVERSKPLSDGTFIRARTNSSGRTVYEVPATDDDLLNKEAALVSKAVRTLALRLIPGDLQEECEAVIRKVRADATAADPDAAKRRMVDAFGKLGISAEALVEYLGHSLDSTTPLEIEELRALHGAIADGEATWAAAMANKAEREAKPPPTPTPTPRPAKPKGTAAAEARVADREPPPADADPFQ